MLVTLLLVPRLVRRLLRPHFPTRFTRHLATQMIETPHAYAPLQQRQRSLRLQQRLVVGMLVILSAMLIQYLPLESLSLWQTSAFTLALGALPLLVTCLLSQEYWHEHNYLGKRILNYLAGGTTISIFIGWLAILCGVCHFGVWNGAIFTGASWVALLLYEAFTSDVPSNNH